MKRVEQFYDESVAREWERLERHRTEYALTMRALRELLPPPSGEGPLRVVDVGSGPGRYALALAAAGYRVTPVDLAVENVRWAARRLAKREGAAFEGFAQANALHLPFAAGQFAAALLLGPLYHLHEHDERLRAVRETMRVVAAGGLIFAAFVTRFAGFRDSAAHYPEWPVEKRAYAEHILRTGVHDDPESGFIHAYFAHPDEIEPLMAEAGLEKVKLLGLEGVVAGHEERVNALEGEAWEVWVELNYRLGHEPSLYGASDHLLFVGRVATPADA
ncbi:MAG: methyltransferase domain-containing protein [Candidatus Promineifilaceae bacterium]|nr:methyltransferase domain-containing protein [Candidatus Promineifilaceae bacterium]